jgi:o-succinylbenzoate synthase
VSIVRIDTTGFRIPFRSALRTARAALSCREGLLVHVLRDDGSEGVGEAAPLPPVPEGPVDRWTTAARSLFERLRGPGTVPPSAGLSPALAAALAAAWDVASADAEARLEGRTVADALGRRDGGPVPVNALLGAVEPETLAVQAARAVRAGFSTVKLKVGLDRDLDQRRLHAVRAAIGPEPRLRVDANGAWTVDRAVRTLDAWQPFALELVEQPVPAHDLVGLAEVRAAVAVQVAADESIAGVEAARSVIDAGAADVLVIKPMVVGGLTPALEIAHLARAAGLGVIVTTTIDTGVGTAAALHLATVVGGELAHGLATASLLQSDLLQEPLPIADGRMSLPSAPGLGITLDSGALSRYRV